MRLRCAIFDLDGTLVDHRASMDRAVVAWGSEQGVDDSADPAVSERWRGICDMHYERYQRREISFTDQRRARVCDFLGRPELSDAEADERFAEYLRLYEAGWTRYDDALPALRRAHGAGLTVALLTNGDEAQQRRKLERVGLIAEIEIFLASSMLPAAKPDPRAFRGVLTRAGVDAPAALMIGDSLTNDIHPALALGLHAVHVDRGVDPRLVPTAAGCALHPRGRRVRTLAAVSFDGACEGARDPGV